MIRRYQIKNQVIVVTSILKLDQFPTRYPWESDTTFFATMLLVKVIITEPSMLIPSALFADTLFLVKML